MKEILIFGSGTHSKVILSEINQIKGYKVIGFVSEFEKKGTLIETYKNKEYRVVGNIKGIKKILNKNTYGIIGIGSNFIRKKVAKNIKKIYKNFNWISIISENSKISGNVVIGKGTLVVSGSIINTGTKIGKHCLINTSSSIDHHNIFKDYSSTGPGVTTGGCVNLGEGSHLGIGSTVIQEISIGDNTMIGAQSVVSKNCHKNSLYFGIPSKKIKTIKTTSKYFK